VGGSHAQRQKFDLRILANLIYTKTKKLLVQRNNNIGNCYLIQNFCLLGQRRQQQEVLSLLLLASAGTVLLEVKTVCTVLYRYISTARYRPGLNRSGISYSMTTGAVFAFLKFPTRPDSLSSENASSLSSIFSKWQYLIDAKIMAESHYWI
jgi:hypothetical protein